MECKFCNGVCACHLNPPCTHCVEHMECELCGQVACQDKAEELTNKSDGDKILVCPDCLKGID